jgi:hypothetical protein
LGNASVIVAWRAQTWRTGAESDAVMEDFDMPCKAETAGYVNASAAIYAH